MQRVPAPWTRQSSRGAGIPTPTLNRIPVLNVEPPANIDAIVEFYPHMVGLIALLFRSASNHASSMLSMNRTLALSSTATVVPSFALGYLGLEGSSTFPLARQTQLS
jgi:hypothetical protein